MRIKTKKPSILEIIDTFYKSDNSIEYQYIFREFYFYL